MSKTHRDNAKARKKRGSVAYKKKEKRRHPKYVKCNICGGLARPKKIINGMCKMCRGEDS